MACAASSCCVRDRPDEPFRLSAGGSHGSVHTWPSIDLVECTDCSQNWLDMACFTPCRLSRFSGTSMRRMLLVDSNHQFAMDRGLGAKFSLCGARGRSVLLSIWPGGWPISADLTYTRGTKDLKERRGT